MRGGVQREMPVLAIEKHVVRPDETHEQNESPLKKLVKWTACLVIGFCVGAVLLLNLRLYVPSPLAPTTNAVPPDLIDQLAANRAALEGNAPAEMQALFPEGYYFCYLFHGLTWAELAMRDEQYVGEAIEQAKWCREHLDSDQAKAPFPSYLPPDHGAFYFAWRVHLQAAIVWLQAGADDVQLDRLRTECDRFAAALAEADKPFLESYDSSVWPCDTIPAIHAMAICDRVTGEGRYQEIVQTWLADVASRFDAETGLIPHTANVVDGHPTSVARATSQMILLRLMPDVDSELALGQYERFRQRYLRPFLLMPSVLEFPSGMRGQGDVDSGPLIFGRSFSATVFMMGVSQVYGDQRQADVIATVGEVVGLPWTSRGQKRYVGGLLPVGDIMVSYAHVARSWTAGVEHVPETRYTVSTWWRVPVHLLSLGFLLLPFAIGKLRRKVAFRANE